MSSSALDAISAWFSGLSNRKPKTTRSPKWPSARKGWLAYHDTCEACGSQKKLQVHHIIPVHIDDSKELDPNNLITLCEQPMHDCHFHWGHLLDWSAYNPSCVEDAKNFRAKVESRPYRVPSSPAPPPPSSESAPPPP